MKLRELIKDCGVTAAALEDIEITGVTSDTRSELERGFAFVCIKGNTFDGHTAAEAMLGKGASVIFCERDLGLDCQIIVPDTRELYPHLCAAWFGNPERSLKMIGVTGTNGKTTITTVLKKMLTGFGCKCGLIGTCQNEIGDEILATARTTPELAH